MKIGVFYGSSTGNTKSVAEDIASKLGTEATDISNASIDDLLACDVLVLGTSTWGQGDLQDDWDAFLPNLEGADLSSKTIALFGLGDQEMYSEEFVNSLGILDKATASAKRIGFWSTDGYNFDESKAVKDGKFVGLVIDADNQEDLTAERVDKWVAQIKSEM
ncbi:MAG: flavodoxin [Helicobacteraceae bacterium]